MKTLINPWFIIGCIVGICILVLRKVHYPLPYYANNYFTAIIAIPVTATAALWVMRVFVFKTNLYRLSAGQVIFIFVYATLIFEIVIPHFFPTYTTDYLNVPLYALGGIFYYKIMNKPII
ncbi:hypothetical protein KXQ82_05260 [Mucilaginibacter sp. HMF5004]|uniref:hypothetical protein n=1 Tax=Mucilaginibacter rivuli TaxID=2857527 RepID=UPI001C5CE95E|nr:hypothetical protein [Mucilaginibacter rivuli]MBW4889110.1 hypothetical protein [Mucilaginibacter rivuli]